MKIDKNFELENFGLQREKECFIRAWIKKKFWKIFIYFVRLIFLFIENIFQN